MKIEGVIQHENSTNDDTNVVTTSNHLSGSDSVNSKANKFRDVKHVKLRMKTTKQGQNKVNNSKVSVKKHTHTVSEFYYVHPRLFRKL